MAMDVQRKKLILLLCLKAIMLPVAALCWVLPFAAAWIGFGLNPWVSGFIATPIFIYAMVEDYRTYSIPVRILFSPIKPYLRR